MLARGVGLARVLVVGDICVAGECCGAAAWGGGHYFRGRGMLCFRSDFNHWHLCDEVRKKLCHCLVLAMAVEREKVGLDSHHIYYAGRMQGIF